SGFDRDAADHHLSAVRQRSQAHLALATAGTAVALDGILPRLLAASGREEGFDDPVNRAMSLSPGTVQAGLDEIAGYARIRGEDVLLSDR
ncbi:MAG: hypothetical protein SVU88_04720, partial [Candidatus Nanohaloarchaea archaeon]|nr:hypothetical protein [Candidatus Nanohaloarchaea archaeon]